MGDHGLKKENILNEERELVRKLRYEDKLKYKEIAQNLNRSLYWVHCRLSDKYKPVASRVEKRFQDDDVIVYFENQGHQIIKKKTRTKCDEFSQEVDVLSMKDGILYVTEVKNIVNHHQLQTAIGQLILHKFGYKEKDPGKTVYQMVFPKTCQTYRYFSGNFLDYLANEFGIKIIFI